VKRQPNTTPDTGKPASGIFRRAIRQILSKPKEEIEEREATSQNETEAKKPLWKKKLAVLTVIALCCLPIHPASASPEERAQMCKTLILKKLVSDGWQLVQESQSLIVVERPLTGWGGPVVQALTTGAYGTKPIIRWSITLIPESDHYTQCSYLGTVNSQNAFGQMTSIPINNKKNLDYMRRLTQAATAELPARYKFVPR